MENKRKEAENMEEYCPVYELETEEELSELNPQVDEPEELDPENDPSVELIDDDIYYDKSGKARSKKTGKWVKLNK